jgi:hypothetical protein
MVLLHKNGKSMSRANESVEKYGLRDMCSVRGKVGQKMDEDCIQRFIAGDPSGNGKYTEWMLLQAGGGVDRLKKSVAQWEKGDHGEAPIQDTLRDQFVADAVKGYTDDNGKTVDPVSKESARAAWATREEEHYKYQHIYGDEEYALTGFGFFRSWPGNNNLYEQIVQAVQRFHRYQAKLKTMGKSLDLNHYDYPNLTDLLSALVDITFLEIKNSLDFDLVYEDDVLQVVCPFNIGASLKFGHLKWCTSNESMMKQAVAGQGPNRWKEYAKDSALLYCTFKLTKMGETSVCQIAVQAPFSATGKAVWKYYDTTDACHSEAEVIYRLREAGGRKAVESFENAVHRAVGFCHNYPKNRLNLEFVVRP